MKLIYENGAIIEVGTNGLLYESISLKHLTNAACRRLAEIHNEQPGIDYEGAETILIAEGLFDWTKRLKS